MYIYINKELIRDKKEETKESVSLTYRLRQLEVDTLIKLFPE